MAALEEELKKAEGSRFKLIATDGVFSMDGIIANLQGVCDLAEKYDAMVMVDDSHAVGFVGKHGRGSAEHCGVEGRVDIITGTLGKALGGASGGYTSGRREVVDWLRQRSRPYLFSNTLMPAIAGASLKVFDMVAAGDGLRRKLYANAARFRSGMTKLGFQLAGADHPIIPVMLGDAALAQEMAQRLLGHGIYVIGFSFPVVPKGQARIRTQMSAAHSEAGYRPRGGGVRGGGTGIGSDMMDIIRFGADPPLACRPSPPQRGRSARRHRFHQSPTSRNRR